MLNFFLSPIFKKLLQMAVTAFVIWYSYDYVFKKPARDIKKAENALTKEYLKKQTMYDGALKIAGKTISDLGQTVYDLNSTIRRLESENSIALTECQNKIDEMKWSENVKKINLDDEFFYVKFPFK